MSELGPFRLFVPEGPWPYFARPQLGAEIAPADVDVVRARQRELGQPEAIEWVHELAPGLLETVRSTGMAVLEAPLMVLDRNAWRAPDPPPRVTVRLLAPDDPALGAARGVASVAFATPGTAPGPAGRVERDAAIPAPEVLAFVAERLRRGVSVAAVAETEGGPVAYGSHQPVGDVTEITAVATLPAARRQGLGGAVTGALVEDALARGADIVFLAASDDAVARVYARLGFRRVATHCIAG